MRTFSGSSPSHLKATYIASHLLLWCDPLLTPKQAIDAAHLHTGQGVSENCRVARLYCHRNIIIIYMHAVYVHVFIAALRCQHSQQETETLNQCIA